jgi:hypothetical protein
MRVTAIQAKTERKRQDKSARCAEKRRRRAGMLRVYGPIRPTSSACATTDPAWGKKTLDQLAQSEDVDVRRQATLGMSASNFKSPPDQLNAINFWAKLFPSFRAC